MGARWGRSTKNCATAGKEPGLWERLGSPLAAQWGSPGTWDP